MKAPDRGKPSRRPGDSEAALGEIVLTAARLDGVEREAYLCEVAATAPELATRARRRLAAADDLPDSFLETSAAMRLDGSLGENEPSAAAAAMPAGERYELGECLGEGGMGRVVRAFDRQLGRTVAIKLLVHEDPAILRLFLREARNQARIQHPHVLEIYDSGAMDGQPFIAMRHVDGGTLDEVAATLSLEHKVRILIQVAEGLHAAHRQGLLHRDVKPSNVLLDAMPDGELVALVADFGLATELEDAAAMAAEAVAGSPHYIAPERLSGTPSAVDRRSDVYSLGVTMYRVLTADLPFGGDNTVEVLRQVLRADPPPPRQHVPGLPKELEAIVLRAVARDPSDRYASARAVAADLRRFLDGEVVEAYAAGVAYRVAHFALRHKLATGLALAMVVVLAFASVAVTVFALRADAARHRAEARQGQAEELLDFMVVDLRDKLDSLGRLDVLVDADAAAMAYFAAVPASELSDAELLRRARMLYQIGDVRFRAGDLEAAKRPMEDSLALTERLAELRPDDPERLFELGQSHFWVGFVHWELGDLSAARASFEAYLVVSRRLIERDSGNDAWQRELSYAHSNLGSVLRAEGDLEGALGHFRATLAIDTKLVAKTGDRAARSELAATHNTVGEVLQDLGRSAEAGGHLTADLELRQALLVEDPADPRMRERLGTSLSRLGIHLSMQGNWPAAGERFEAANQVFAELVDHDPANTPWRFKLAWSHLQLGRTAFAWGDLDAAAKAFARQGELIDALLARDAPHAWRRTRAIGLYHRALVANARGRAEPDTPAHAGLVEAVAMLEELATLRPADRRVRRWLAQSQLLHGHFARDRASAQAAFQRAEETLAPIAPGSRDSRLLAPWATALRCLGRLEEARSVAADLATTGHQEPGLAALCP